jgi:hypothetical protein
MGKSILKRGFQFTGPTPHGFTWGLVLLKDLPKTANTVWYFHENLFENVFAIYGSNALWVYMGFSAIERLT